MYIPDRANDRYEALISGEMQYCFGGGKSKPKTPDYKGAAEATAASNMEALKYQTQANRPNQNTPWGQESWTQDAAGNWTQNTTLNEDSQRALDAELGLQADRSELGQDMYGRMEQEFGQEMDWGNLPEWGQVAQAKPVEAGNIEAGTIMGGNAAQARELTPEQMQRGVDFSGAEQRTSAEDARNNAEDAIYGRATSRLDPQWEQRESEKQAKLVAQGLRPGDPAYDKAMENMSRERNDAYDQAQYGAIMGGGQEASRTLGDQRAGREQDMGQTMNEGNFANTATGQQFGMDQTAGNQNFQQDLASEAQRFGQEATAGDQNFRQAAAAGDQNFRQDLASSDQNFNQETSQSQQQSQMRNAQMAEEMQKRGFSLNEINAIISGQQTQMPDMPGFQPAGRADGVDYSGAAQSQGQFDIDAANSKNSLFNSALQGAGMVGSAYMMSDRRLKRNIERLGTVLGYPWYVFQYVWGEWAFGFMSDEINQDAVIRLPNGYDMVDLTRVK